jgi:hypothetical protein
VAAGFTLPVPGCRTIEARPDAVFEASAGGFETFSGAGIGVKAGGFCWLASSVALHATTVAPSATVSNRTETDFIILILLIILCLAPLGGLAAGVEAAVDD